MLPTVFLPFNVVKGGLNMALILCSISPWSPPCARPGLVPESQVSTQGRKLGAGYLLFSLALLATFVTIALVLMGIL